MAEGQARDQAYGLRSATQESHYETMDVSCPARLILSFCRGSGEVQVPPEWLVPVKPTGERVQIFNHQPGMDISQSEWRMVRVVMVSYLARHLPSSFWRRGLSGDLRRRPWLGSNGLTMIRPCQ